MQQMQQKNMVLAKFGITRARKEKSHSLQMLY